MNTGTFRKAGVFGLLLALILLVSGCSGGLFKGKTSSDATASASASAAATPTLTADQQLASTACLTADEQKATQPGADGLDKKLLETCRTVGQKTFDSLSDANKKQKMVADMAAELKTTDSLNRAAFIVSSLKNVKEVDAKGVTISDQQALAAQIKSFLPNANQGDVNIGSTGDGAVDKTKHTVETGGAPFYHGNNITYLDSTATIAAWFASGSPESNAAKERVTAAIKATGGNDTEVARAMTGAGYIPIQFKDASQVMGTTYFQNGIKPVDQWRQSKPGDIYWLYITSNGVLVPDATLRGDCGNVSAKQIRIMKPGIPPAPSVSQPPGEETCPMGTVLQPNGECKPPVGQPTCSSGCTPPSGCQSNCAPPPSGCQSNCTPPPSGCTSNCDTPKDPSQDPAPRSNAGNGGGTNADPGPGTYVAPTQMQQPPSTPRENPAPPAPQPAPVTQPASGGGTTVIPAPTPISTPRNTPPPQQGANPTPTQGATQPPANDTKPTPPPGF